MQYVNKGIKLALNGRSPCTGILPENLQQINDRITASFRCKAQRHVNLTNPFRTRCCTQVVTARKRSLGQGNIFIGVCQEFCSQGGCLLPGVSVPGGGGCLVQGVSARGGACSGGWCLLPGGVPGGDPHGWLLLRYASYWNAFLL